MIMEEKITAWIARDEDNYLGLYTSKPIKNEYGWQIDSQNADFMILKNTLFPQVKWEDDEPTEVELTIKIK